MSQLHQWSLENDRYGFALSNPNFEYWLLLHFEDGSAVNSSRDCVQRLKRYLPDYDKGIDINKITRNMIDNAIRRARFRDTPSCVDWPYEIGGTTVYKLVEHIISS